MEARSDNCNLLLHTLRQAANQGIPLLQEREALERPRDLHAQTIIINTANLTYELEKLLGRESSVERRILGQVTDNPLGHLRLLDNVMAPDADGPAGWPEDAN